VKINPANIGVGMYQHDVKAKHLRESLDAVVNSCVNFVGVDVNTASPALLSYVSGFNQLTARRLYDYRREHGPFRNREQIKNVPGIGEATFVQAAGFLKITLGDNPLDSTWIHPESYPHACQLLEKLDIPLSSLLPAQPAGGPIAENSTGSDGTPAQEAAPASSAAAELGEPAANPSAANVVGDGEVSAPVGEAVGGEAVGGEAVGSEAVGSEAVGSEAVGALGTGPEASNAASAETATGLAAPADVSVVAAGPARPLLAERLANVPVRDLAQELGIGELTLQDILAALSRPGRDPRDDFSPPPFRTGIMKLDDLKPGMELQGTVLNVVDFGAFVDIGISDSALIHISKLADRYIRDPQEVVSVGDVLKVWVLNVDRDRRRVSLTAMNPQAEARPREHYERRPRRGKPQAAAAPAAAATPAPARGNQGAGSRRPPPRTPVAKNARPARQKPPAPKRPPKPVRPITTAMLSGKQPMRSFSDLLQYYEKKSQDHEPPGPP
ncbi:MAG: helix-hairpin-helix domain-containing protein, partial [Pirellulaceae bacterium]